MSPFCYRQDVSSDFEINIEVYSLVCTCLFIKRALEFMYSIILKYFLVLQVQRKESTGIEKRKKTNKSKVNENKNCYT